MAIPDLDDDGFLPEGVHECSLDEIDQRFGGNQSAVRRSALFAKLREYIQELRSTGMAAGLIVDGSFITNKTEPNDIDLVLILLRDMISTRSCGLSSTTSSRDGGFSNDMLSMCWWLATILRNFWSMSSTSNKFAATPLVAKGS